MKTKNLMLCYCCVLLGLICPVVCHAQAADRQIGELINTNDWFALEREYPKLKGEVQSPMLRALSETLLHINFNRPDSAQLTIMDLLANHQPEMGLANTTSMIYYNAQTLSKQGRYAEAADFLGNFLNQIAVSGNREDYPEHLLFYGMMNKLREVNAPVLIRPAHDTEVPFYIEEVGKGRMLFIPVVIRGKEYRFIYDTGSGGSFVSQRFADDMCLRVVNDSTWITGLGRAMGKTAVADSLFIGDMVYTSALFTVAPSIPEVDTVVRVDAVLGRDFMERVGEAHICFREGKIVFPIRQTSLPATGRNLMVQNEQPYVELMSGTERLLFHFDTGNILTSMSDSYYQKHKEWVEVNGQKDTLCGGGFGGLDTMEVYRLPVLQLQIGGSPFEIQDISVGMKKAGMFQRREDGFLGVDFIFRFHKVIINLDRMFVEAVPL